MRITKAKSKKRHARPATFDPAQTATAIFASIRRNNPRKSKVVRTAKVIFEVK